MPRPQPKIVGKRKNALEHITMQQYIDIYHARFGHMPANDFDRKELMKLGAIDLVMEYMYQRTMGSAE